MTNTPLPVEAEPLVKVDTTIGLDEVAAIKVAEAERELLMAQEALQRDLKSIESSIAEDEKKFPELLLKDTRKSYPQIDKINAAMKSLFGSGAKISVNLDDDKKVTITIYQNWANLPWKGKESKELHEKICKMKQEVSAIEDKICQVKKKLAMLPHLERSAKAAVAKARLEQTQEGRNLLKQLEKIPVPALPAPKK